MPVIEEAGDLYERLEAAQAQGRLCPLRQTPDGWAILTLHYSVVPSYDFVAACRGLSDEGIQQELEISWAASSGKRVYPQFGRHHHVARDPIAFDPRSVLYCGWDWGNCYCDQTEVMTDDGWKLFKDVDADKDLIASRNSDTGEMEYVPVERKIALSYQGDMLCWQSQSVDLCVTPDHIIPYRDQARGDRVQFDYAHRVAARNHPHCRVDLLSEWKGGEIPESIFEMSPETFSEFMGLYLSEGATDIRGRTGRVTIYQKYADPEFERILGATGRGWKRQEGNKNAGWRCSDLELATYLKSFGTAHTKYVPDVIKRMPAALIRRFVEAYMMGDGLKRTTRPREQGLYTTSSRMASDMQELGQKIGYGSSCRRVNESRQTLDEGGVKRVIRSGGGFVVRFKRRRYAGLSKARFSRVAYNGLVYCLTVKHHTLYVRRNGVPSWNGNCPAFVPSQVNSYGQWLIFPPLTTPEDVTVGTYEFGQMVADYLLREFALPCGKDLAGLRTLHYGDPAGAGPPVRTGDSPKETRSHFDIIRRGIEVQTGYDSFGRPAVERRPGWGWRIRPGAVNITDRLEAVRARLSLTLSNGTAALVVDPRAEILIEGFLGGYHYKQRLDGRYEYDPEKNLYSHPFDALGYIATRLFSHGVPTESEDDEDRPKQQGFVSHASALRRYGGRL